jgi:tetratricopeptide (TPR) repeat protein
MVGYQLPKDTFVNFENTPTRMLVGVTCLRSGFVDLAYQVFASIVEEGPQENANRQFAYVRSLIEMAELDAERGNFAQAEQKMTEALSQYPSSMGYMMSRVHLEIYLSYYQFQSGKRDEALQRIASIVDREKQRFTEMPQQDALSLVSPGLCYAIHQWALFYADEGDWEEAFLKFKEMRPYCIEINEQGWEEAEALFAKGEKEQAFNRLSESVLYTGN